VKPTVLVVDDRVVNREFLSTLIGYAGFEVLTAGDGAEALEVVRAHRPALVISDVLMPTMDGFEFVTRLRRDPDPGIAAMPIIFYTATYRLTEARELARSCGVAKVLSKPSEPEEILAAITEMLGVAPAAAMAAAVGVETPGTLGDPLPEGAHGLVELERLLQRAAGESGTTAPAAAAGPPVWSGTVHALSLRLAAMLELGLVFASERDPQRLLVLAARAARDILSARYAVIALGVGPGRPLRWAVHGMSAEEEARVIGALDPHGGIFGELLADGRPRRFAGPAADPSAVGLPAGHPSIRNLLAVRVASGSRTNGWIYVAGKLGADAFGEEDEQLAATLAAQLAPSYESLVLLGEVERHADRLEREIGERERAAAELAESELRFRQLAENIREVFFLVDPANTRMLYVSPAHEEIWGQSREALYEDPRAWFDPIHPDDREAAAESLVQMAAGEEFDYEFRIVRPDGELRWIRARGFPIRDAAGEVYRVAGIADDITERREHEQRIARLTRIYAVLTGINSAIVRIRDRIELFQEVCRIAVTEGVFEMAWVAVIDPGTLEGKVVARAGGRPSYLEGVRISARPDAPESARPASRALREGRPVVCNDIAADPVLSSLKSELLDRGHRSVAAFPLMVDGDVAAVLSLFGGEAGLFDEQELKLLEELAGDISFGLQYIEKEETLHYLAYYDGLTGLVNGALFHDRLTQLLPGARNSQAVVAVLLIDLDRFTRLNDTLGRHAGDALLRAVAERFDEALGDEAILARIGADTFAVAVAGLRHGTDVATVLHEKVFASLGPPFAVDDKEILITARAGIALYPDDGDDAATLFKNAEAALKRAQSSGERALFYAPEINARAAEKLELESRLRRAIEGEQFVLHYQPRVDAASGRTVGLEALIRWQEPEQGLIPPGRFIPVLEESGMILEVGRWALASALADHRRWREAGLEPPRVAVNVSAIELRQPAFADVVGRALADSGAASDALELEITESLIMDDIEATTEVLQRLSDLGVAVAVDDFGTGHSSLSYLAKLPVQSLKIDRSFIDIMVDDPDSTAIVSTVISLAHALDLQVVAEGVETEEQAKLLRLMRCDELQGFLFSKPVPAGEIAALLGDGSRGS
jgi:diguanylate cyclase (GGDEF)-like protein/PAS domain S-box-containing protein